MTSPIERLKVSLDARPRTPCQWKKIEVLHVLQNVANHHSLSPFGVLHLVHSMNSVFKHEGLGDSGQVLQWLHRLPVAPKVQRMLNK